MSEAQGGQARGVEFFVPPEPSIHLGALGRFLTKLPANVLDTYLAAYTVPGDVVLDPFAHSDALARAASRCGRRAVLSDLNPLTCFISRTTLLAVTGRELQAAFDQLSRVKQAQAPLASHLDGLYATDCPRCGASAVATAFIWDRRLDGPIAKRCLCHSCHFGEAEPADLVPVTEADVARLHETEPRGFHYWYLVDRFGHDAEGHGDLAVQLLDLYTRRNAYALATIVRHIEGSKLGENVRHLLKLALLDCLCSCSKLEPLTPTTFVSSDIDLRPPARYVERNVWRRFTSACAELRQTLEARGGETSPARLAVSVDRLYDNSAYSRLGNPPNTAVLRQAARHLQRDLPNEGAAMVLTSPPGPGHGTFLCLSYLWSGWLLGPGQAHGLEQIPCSRRPLDWAAYYRAVAAALRGLLPTLKTGAPVVLLFEAESRRQCDMLALAGLTAGLELRRVLCQGTGLHAAVPVGQDTAGHYVLEFAKPESDPSSVHLPASGAAGLEALVRQQIDVTLKNILALRAEPTPYLYVHVAALEHLAKSGLLLALLAAKDFDGLAVADMLADEVVAGLERGERRRTLTKFAGKSSVWSLAKQTHGAVGLTDRVERATYELLNNTRLVSTDTALRLVHGLFPGLTTPEAGFIEECLSSYGRRAREGEWTLAEGEREDQRQQAHTRAVVAVADLGRRFGYHLWIGREEQKRRLGGGTLGQVLSVEERYTSPAGQFGGIRAADVDVIWYDGRGTVWLFEVEWTAMISQAVVGRRLPISARRHLVVLDERVPLLQSKLRRGPWLQQYLDADGWEFIKLGHLLSFARADESTQQSLGSIVGLKPPVEGAQAHLPMM
ncbi:MAG: hypothetical protein M1401_03555 [Chloroflexi bacterium]|nr:hypothetical protein [Chloroflexota bacterium]MCL5107943.1 hypothetical protein [Chloroflexota bacterium]